MNRIPILALLLLATLVLAPVIGVAPGHAEESPGHAAEPPETPTVVEIGLYLIDITSLDQREETFGIELDVVTRWKDPRRGFDPEIEGVDRLVFRQDAARNLSAEGWWPELFITNTVGQMGMGMRRSTVYPDGTVMNRARIEATLRAPLDFRGFPFDNQVLPIHVESYGFPSDELVLEIEEDFSGFDPEFEMPEWDLTGADGVISDQLRVQEGRDFSHLLATLEVKRMSGYYLWKVLLPLIVITMISWVVFWMSDDFLGRRAGVSATGMLTVIAYQFVIADSLPRFPYLTVLDRILLITLVFIAMTMLVNLVTSRMDQDGRFRFDRSCRLVFPLSYFGILLAILIPALT